MLRVLSLTAILLFGVQKSSAQSSALAPRFQGRISILVALPAKSEAEANLKVAGPRLPSFVKAEQDFVQNAEQLGIELRWIYSAGSQDIVEAMNDPANVGVIVIAETQIKDFVTRDVDEPRVIYNVELHDADKSSIPKNILTSAHPALQFVAFNICFFTAVEDYYRFKSPVSFRIEHPYSFDRERLDQLDLGSQSTEPRLGLRNIYNKLGPALAQDLVLYRQELSQLSTETPSASLEVSYSDLLSSRYTYTVEVNGSLVGVLKPGVRILASTKIQTSEGSESFSVPSYLLSPGPQKIVIRPDDPDRKVKVEDEARTVDYAVDDILLRKVTWRGKDILSPPDLVHIGDQDPLDEKIKLSDRRHWNELRSSKVLSLWEAEVED